MDCLERVSVSDVVFPDVNHAQNFVRSKYATTRNTIEWYILDDEQQAQNPDVMRIAVITSPLFNDECYAIVKVEVTE